MSMVVIVLMIKALVTVVSIIMLIMILEKMGVVKMMLTLKSMMVFIQIYFVRLSMTYNANFHFLIQLDVNNLYCIE